MLAEVSLKTLLALKTQLRSCFASGDGGEEAELEQSCARSSATALGSKIKGVGPHQRGRHRSLSLRQGAGDKDESIESGHPKEKAHERHQQHIRAGQEVRGGIGKRERGLSMRRLGKRQRRQSVGRPASKKGL
jgi:hypothetical protein